MKKILVLILVLAALQITAHAKKEELTPMQLRCQEELKFSNIPVKKRTLYAAILSGNFNLAERLLCAGVDPDDKYFRLTPVSCAIVSRDDNILKLLLDYGADPNLTFVSLTPLSYAISQKYTEGAKILIKNGADITIVSAGYSPLDLAVQMRNVELTKILYDMGAPYSDLTRRNALKSINEDIKKIFSLEEDADNVENKEGQPEPSRVI